MEWPPVAGLATFMAAILVVVMFIIAASGHFPAEHRKPALAGPAGTAIIVGTSIIVAAVMLIAAVYAWLVLPWYAAVIGAGLMILIAPYALHPLPDSVVNGRGALLFLAVAAAVLAGLMTLV